MTEYNYYASLISYAVMGPAVMFYLSFALRGILDRSLERRGYRWSKRVSLSYAVSLLLVVTIFALLFVFLS